MREPSRSITIPPGPAPEAGGPGPWAGTLDALATAVFGTPQGRSRIAPLLARWDAQVGPLREEDPEHARMQAVRADWALCDAEVDGHPGDTWAWRAAAGRVPGVPPSDALQRVARSVAGLWWVTPGRRAWLCDCLSGIGVELASPIRLPAVARGHAVLWDARVVIVDGAAQLCRPPLAYPGEVGQEVRRRGLARLRTPYVDSGGISDAGARHAVLMRLRRTWLHCARAPRADPRVLFADGIVRARRR